MLDQIKMGEYDVGHMKMNEKAGRRRRKKGEMKNEQDRIKMNKFYGLMVV